MEESPIANKSIPGLETVTLDCDKNIDFLTAIAIFLNYTVSELKQKLFAAIDSNATDFTAILERFKTTLADIRETINNGDALAGELEIAMLTLLLQQPIYIIGDEGKAINAAYISPSYAKPIFVYFDGQSVSGLRKQDDYEAATVMSAVATSPEEPSEWGYGNFVGMFFGVAQVGAGGALLTTLPPVGYALMASGIGSFSRSARSPNEDITITSYGKSALTDAAIGGVTAGVTGWVSSSLTVARPVTEALGRAGGWLFSNAAAGATGQVAGRAVADVANGQRPSFAPQDLVVGAAAGAMAGAFSAGETGTTAAKDLLSSVASSTAKGTTTAVSAQIADNAVHGRDLGDGVVTAAAHGAAFSAVSDTAMRNAHQGFVPPQKNVGPNSALSAAQAAILAKQHPSTGTATDEGTSAAPANTDTVATAETDPVYKAFLNRRGDNPQQRIRMR